MNHSKTRYTSTMGVVYEIAPDADGYLLCVVRTDVKMIRRKEVVSERKQNYLRSSYDDCLRYMLEVDKFKEHILSNFTIIQSEEEGKQKNG